MRGPLKLLKEKFLSDNVDSLNRLQYVTDFRTKLTKANLVSAQKSMKASYVLLVTPDRRKQRQLCHINMLKEYVDRNNSTTVHPVSANVAVLETDETVHNFKENADLPGTARLKNSEFFEWITVLIELEMPRL